MKQDEIFATFEGNNWFSRNQIHLQQCDPKGDFPLTLLELYHLRPHHVVEIGAANGFRLATIATRYNAHVVAVEPSTTAILDGSKRFPGVKFIKGESHAVPLHDSFDLVIVNFVLHWVDRTQLFRSFAEIDRLLVDGGFLIIGDFFPANKKRIPYHHLVEHEVFTYKQNYAAPFLASGLYQVIGLITGDHGMKTLQGEVHEYERIGAFLLRKHLTAYYND